MRPLDARARGLRRVPRPRSTSTSTTPTSSRSSAPTGTGKSIADRRDLLRALRQGAPPRRRAAGRAGHDARRNGREGLVHVRARRRTAYLATRVVRIRNGKASTPEAIAGTHRADGTTDVLAGRAREFEARRRAARRPRLRRSSPSASCSRRASSHRSCTTNRPSAGDPHALLDLGRYDRMAHWPGSGPRPRSRRSRSTNGSWRRSPAPRRTRARRGRGPPARAPRAARTRSTPPARRTNGWSRRSPRPTPKRAPRPHSQPSWNRSACRARSRSSPRSSTRRWSRPAPRPKPWRRHNVRSSHSTPRSSRSPIAPSSHALVTHTRR